MDTSATVAFANTDFIVMSGIGSGLYLREGNTVVDWYNQQTLGLTNLLSSGINCRSTKYN